MLNLQRRFRRTVETAGNPADVTDVTGLYYWRILFGRMRSRFMGRVGNFYLPRSWRKQVFGTFALMNGISEEDIKNLRYPLDSHKTLNEFFSRAMVDECRPVCSEYGMNTLMTSPVDGTVLTVGEITSSDGRVRQVKGATYNVASFLGVDPFLG